MKQNIALLPWHAFLRNLMFWQATWFLYFQAELSASQAIVLYAIFELATTSLEVPSGYFSDRIGRKITLALAALASFIGLICLCIGGTFTLLALGVIGLGAGTALTSGTNTALLYQSLVATNQQDQMEPLSIRIWRFEFAALAVSALTGGIMAHYNTILPFVASAGATFALLILTLFLTEPARTGPEMREIDRFRVLRSTLSNPTLLWIFSIGVLMYGYSHVPFVFGQPFIDQVMAQATETFSVPILSGGLATIMMLLSLGVSTLAPQLKAIFGFSALILFAFLSQIGLVYALSQSSSISALALLMLRMVPDAISTPFLLARIQPLLSENIRATFLSMQSLFGRLLFSASLWLVAGRASDVGNMRLYEVQTILLIYSGVGLCIFWMFLIGLRRLPKADRPYS